MDPAESPAVPSLQAHAVAVLQRLGYTCLSPAALALERDSLREVLLVDRLVAALRRLNPGIPEAQVHAALRELTELRAPAGAPQLPRLHQRAHALLTQGFCLDKSDAHGAAGPGTGRRPRVLRYIDWNEPATNDFVVTWQLPVRGSRQLLVFDLVVFVNGIPLVVLACPVDAPGPGGAWQRDALHRLWRAQEVEPAAADQGAPRLFATVHLLAALAEQSALVGGVHTPPHRFTPWQTCWPRTRGQAASLLGRDPTASDLLLLGMLPPPTLFELLQHFIVFAETPPTAATEPLLCRASEFLAVQQAFQTARSGAPLEQQASGGLLWHAGGQVESRQLLTLAFLLRKLRADADFAARAIVVVVTDNDSLQALIQLLRPAALPVPGEQQRSDTRPAKTARRRSKSAAAPAPAAPRLPLFGEPAGLTIITADELQQRLDAGRRAAGAGPPRSGKELRLGDSCRPIVMFTHVLQPPIRELTLRVREVLPGACLLGFTTLPPGPHDAAVVAPLGPLLARCSFADAVAEGVAVPVYLETRDPELHRPCEDPARPPSRIGLGEESEPPYALAVSDRVRLIGHNLSSHFRRVVRPQGGWAQLIVRSEQEAQLYKEALARSGGLVAVVADSHSAAASDAGARLGEPATVRLPDLLICCRPPGTAVPDSRLHAVYVDALLADAELLECVVAVSAPAMGKRFGLVVDYAGATAGPTAPSALLADALRRPEEELLGLQQALREALRLVSGAQNLYSIEQCLTQLSRPESRAALDAALARCTGSLELLHDDPRVQGLLVEFCWLAQVLLAAAARYRDDRIEAIACGPRLRQRLAECVARDGTELLITRVDLLSPRLDDKLAVLEDRAAQLSELSQALAHAIEEHSRSRPGALAGPRAALHRLLSEHKMQPQDAETRWRALCALRQTVAGQLGRGAASPLSPVAQILYAVLTAVPGSAAADATLTYGQADDADCRALAVRLASSLAPSLAAAADSAAVAELQSTLMKELLTAGYAPERAAVIRDQALQRLGVPPAQAT